MTIPLRLGILNNKDNAGNTNRIPACGFGIGGKWRPIEPGEPIVPYVTTPYVGYWKLDESAGAEAIDISENILPMEYIGDLKLGISNAPYFDGATTYLRGENIALYDSTSEISIVAYYKVDSPPNPHGTIVSKYIDPTTGTSWGIFLMADGKLQMAVNGGQNVQSVNSFFTEGITYKIAFTYDGTNTKLYVNNVEETLTGSMSGNVDKELTNINIGRTEGGTSFFKGWIRNVIIYRYILTLIDVIALPELVIDGENSNPTPETKAYRDLITAITYDKTHFGLDDGTVGISDIGIPSTIVWNNLGPFESIAIAGQAPELIPDNKSWGTLVSNSFTDNFQYDSHTINMWCYMNSWPSEKYDKKKDKKATLIVRYKSNGEPGYMITIFAPGVVAKGPLLRVITSTQAGRIISYALLSKSIAIKNWFMISTVVDDTAGTIGIYINGVLSNITTDTYTPGTLSNETYPIPARLGTRDAANTSVPEFFKGYMEEITIVGGALPASDLLNLYNTGNHNA